MASAPVQAVPGWLQASDGRALACTWIAPTEVAVHAVAVLSAAGGVPQRHYSHFAQWLAGRGYAVLTYDHRGIGSSRAAAGADEPATMVDWARLDMAAALAAARVRAAAAPLPQLQVQPQPQPQLQTHPQPSLQPPLPLLWVGHSFGGNAVAFAPGVLSVDAFLFVAAGLGARRLVRWPQRALLLGAHHLWLPVLLRLFGHLPGWALGAGAQALPAGVVRQHLRWCGLRRWAFDDPALRPQNAAAAVTAPLHLWSFADDRLHASAASVDALAAQFSAAAVQRHHLHTREMGVTRLGHFGAFSRRAGPALWLRWLQPLEAALPRLQPPRPLPAAAAAPVYSATHD